MRFASIDILRMIAVFVMVFVHFGENLSGYTPPYAGLGAPLFAFLSGVSYHLWVQGQQRRGRDDLEIMKVSIRRGLFIFGVGVAFNVLVWLPEDVFNWDVLTFVGCGLMLLAVVRQLPPPVLVAMAVTALFVAPPLREIVDYSAYWQNRYFDPEWTLTDLFIGFFVTGYFPLFPWLVFPLGGFVTAGLLFPDDSIEESTPLSPWVLVGVGAAGLGLACLLVTSGLSTSSAASRVLLGGWTMFPPTTSYVVGMLGANLLLLGLGHRGVDLSANVGKSRWLEIPKQFSRYSFTIYVVHHLVHVWPLWIVAIARGQETTRYWMNAMPLPAALALAVLFLVVTGVTLRAVRGERTYGIEAAMRWLCD